MTQNSMVATSITSFKIEFSNRVFGKFTRGFPVPYSQMDYEINMTEYEL